MQHFFKPVLNTDSDDDDGDNSKKFETRTMSDPSKVKWWTLVWVPHTPYLTFASVFEGNVEQPQFIDIETKIKKFDPKGRDIINLLCSSIGEDPYYFAILIDAAKKLLQSHMLNAQSRAVSF